MRKSSLFSKKELALFTSSTPIFNDDQMKFINKKTPASEIEVKTDKDGHPYKTVKASYVKALLMMVTGGNYNFVIKTSRLVKSTSEAVVEGCLTINLNGRSASRDQFGQHYLIKRTETSADEKEKVKLVSDVGNGYKAAATDALKKCAAEFGFCWDIFSQERSDLKKKELPEVTHAEQKILDRLEHFLKNAANEEELEAHYEKFLEASDETANSKALFQGYMNRILNNSIK